VFVDFTSKNESAAPPNALRRRRRRARERYLSIGIPRRRRERERERERREEKPFALFCEESCNSGGERLERERDGGGVKRPRDVFFIPRIGRRREC
jgi:hypothetical protein